MAINIDLYKKGDIVKRYLVPWDQFFFNFKTVTMLIDQKITELLSLLEKMEEKQKDKKESFELLGKAKEVVLEIKQALKN